MKNSDIDLEILENIDINKAILENIDIDMEILQNINIDKISHRLAYQTGIGGPQVLPKWSQSYLQVVPKHVVSKKSPSFFPSGPSHYRNCYPLSM